MTDRELLEKAARAAQKDLSDWEYFEETGQFIWQGTPSSEGTMAFQVWNPLTDDGDALRLAVKLRLTIDIERDRHCVTVGDHSGRFGVQACGPDGYEEATRRAIVRAAAAVGEGLLPFPSVEEIREFTGDHGTQNE